MDIDNEKVLQESLKIHLMYKDAKAAGTIDITKLTSQAKELYPYITEKIPSIVNIALGDSYDFDRLKFMLDMHIKVKNNEITEKEGSIQVGQVLVDDIVKPSLEKK